MAENKRKLVVEEEKEIEVDAPVEVKKKPRPIRPSKNSFRFTDIFGVFKRNEIARAMPFVLFVTALIIVYIGNSYYAEKVIREIEKTKSQLKEHRAEYISTMSDLMTERKQSELAKQLLKYDLKESTNPPQKIFSEQKKSK